MEVGCEAKRQATKTGLWGLSDLIARIILFIYISVEMVMMNSS